MAEKRDYTISVVRHTLRVLQTFLEDTRAEQSAKEISERLGLNRVRVFRILSTLEYQGFVRQDPQTKRYRLGLKLFQLGQAVARQFDLTRVADSILAELAEKTGETTYVYALDGLEAVTVAKRESKQPMPISPLIGHRDTLEVGAACNLLLAYLPPEDIDKVLNQGPLPRRSERSVTDPREVKRRLVEIRRLGYHLTRCEEEKGVNAVAAPIRNSSGQVVAALALAGPSVRFTSEKTRFFLSMVCEAARRISTEIGYIPPPDEPPCPDLEESPLD